MSEPLTLDTLHDHLRKRAEYWAEMEAKYLAKGAAQPSRLTRDFWVDAYARKSVYRSLCNAFESGAIEDEEV